VLQAKFDSADEPPPLLHLGMAKLYRQKVSDIAQALEHPDTRTEAAEAIRGLIDEIVLTPDTHPSDGEQGAPSIRLTEALVETTRASSKPAAARSDRKLGFRPLAASRGDEHVQVHPHARRCGVTGWDHALDEQQRRVGRHRSANVAQDGDGLVVAPVVDDRFEDVQVATLRYSFEEAAADQLAPIADTRSLLQVTRPPDGFASVEQDPARRRVRPQDVCQQGTVGLGRIINACSRRMGSGIARDELVARRIEQSFVTWKEERDGKATLLQELRAPGTSDRLRR
jgi:hypothetical protein